MAEVQVIVDTGPIVAFLVCEETHHPWVKEQFEQLPAPFLPCEAALTEAFFLVRKLRLGPSKFFALINSGLLRTDFSLIGEARNIEALISKYSNVPMSLADACLVRLAELNPQSTIFTLDGDFKIYRMHGRRVISALMPPATP